MNCQHNNIRIHENNYRIVHRNESGEYISRDRDNYGDIAEVVCLDCERELSDEESREVLNRIIYI